MQPIRVLGILLSAALITLGTPQQTCEVGRAGPGARTGRALVTNQQAQSASIIDLDTGQVTHVPLPGFSPHGGAVSPDGRWGVVADYGGMSGTHLDGNRVAVIDMTARRVVRTIDFGDQYRAAHDVAFASSSSSRVVVTAQKNHHIVEVDILDGRVIGAIGTRGAGSHSLAISADGRRVVTANEEESFMSVLDMTTREFVAARPIGGNPYGIALTPDGRLAWVGTRGAVRVVDVERGEVVASLSGTAFPDDISMSPDGTRIAIADQAAHRVHVAEGPGRRMLSSIAVDRPHSAFIHADNRTVYATMGHQNALAVIDVVQGCVVARHAVQSWPDEVGWGPRPAGK